METFSLSTYNTAINYDENILLYNSRNNNLIYLSEEEYFDIVSKIQNNKTTAIENSNILIDYGYIVDSNRDEKSEIIYAFEKKKHISNALNLTIAITNKCNLSCHFCYVKKHDEVSMSKSVQDALLQFIRIYEKHNQLRKLFVTWTGGEPTIEINLIQQISKQLIAYCESKNIEYFANIISNGTLIDKRFIEVFKKIRINGIQISIEPNDILESIKRPNRLTNKGLFHKSFESLTILRPHLPVSLRIALSKSNKEHIVGFVKKLKTDGLLGKNILFSMGHLHLKNNTNLSVLKDLLSSHEYANTYFGIFEELFNENVIINTPYPKLSYGCGAYRNNTLTIDADGFIYKCFEDIFDNSQSIGNVLEGHLPKPNYKNMKWLLYNYDFEKLECYYCKILPVCNGGCHMMRKFSSESVIGTYRDYGCNEWKHGLNKGLRLYAKSIIKRKSKNR